MSKKRKEVEEVKADMVEDQPEVKLVPLKRALSIWRKKNPDRGMFLDDYEAVELFVKRTYPTLEATQEEFDAVLAKY